MKYAKIYLLNLWLLNKLIIISNNLLRIRLIKSLVNYKILYIKFRNLNRKLFRVLIVDLLKNVRLIKRILSRLEIFCKNTMNNLIICYNFTRIKVTKRY
jgi:hypothetical protein